jgi:dCTP deaminase
MLVDRQIRDAIAKKQIIIEPYSPSAIEPSAYTFVLGRYLLIPKAGQRVSFREGKAPEYQKLDISKQVYILKPLEFVLGQTEEVVTLDKNIGMIVDGKTTNARLGLSIHQTATTVFPGHTNSIITLEMFNAGPMEIELVPGIEIAKGIFFRLSENADHGYSEVGSYASQKEVTGAKIKPFKN